MLQVLCSMYCFIAQNISSPFALYSLRRSRFLEKNHAIGATLHWVLSESMLRMTWVSKKLAILVPRTLAPNEQGRRWASFLIYVWLWRATVSDSLPWKYHIICPPFAAYFFVVGIRNVWRNRGGTSDFAVFVKEHIVAWHVLSGDVFITKPAAHGSVYAKDTNNSV